MKPTISRAKNGYSLLYCAHKMITWKGKIKRRETGGGGGVKINKEDGNFDSL